MYKSTGGGGGRLVLGPVPARENQGLIDALFYQGLPNVSRSGRGVGGILVCECKLMIVPSEAARENGTKGEDNKCRMRDGGWWW